MAVSGSRRTADIAARWRAPVLAGLALGLLATATDVWGGSSRTLAVMGELAGPWLLVAAAVGRVCDRARVAAMGGLVTLVVGVVTYDAVILGQGGPPLFAALWLVMAVVVGPVGGVLGQLSTRAGHTGVAVHALVWGVAIGEVAARTDPLNNRLAWLAGALAIGAVATAPSGRRARVAIGTVLVAAVAAAVFPLLLSGVAGW